MKPHALTLLLLICFWNGTLAQYSEKERNHIVQEGTQLYLSEMASWYGTDLFLSNFPERRSEIGGYFSYATNDSSKCIFFSNSEIPEVIGTISFDHTFNIQTANLNGTKRDFTSREQSLFEIRQLALQEISTDSMFQVYSNTNLNLIPIIYGETKKVFVLTGPQKNGIVIFGNDYLLTFDKNNNLESKRALHANIIVTDYTKEKESGNKVVTAMHTHLPSTGDLITSTDICTLMLYADFAGWEQYIVISEKYVSMWNCKNHQLLILTKKAWEKINDDQEKRNNK